MKTYMYKKSSRDGSFRNLDLDSSGYRDWWRTIARLDDMGFRLCQIRKITR